jgi:hypothetical protein
VAASDSKERRVMDVMDRLRKLKKQHRSAPILSAFGMTVQITPA